MDAVTPREQVVGQGAANAGLDVGIEGMTCASCVGRVERTIRKIPGVSDVEVNLGTEHARIAFSGKLDAAALAEAVRGAGPN
jgi:Cu+-exporting ATPase